MRVNLANCISICVFQGPYYIIRWTYLLQLQSLRKMADCERPYLLALPWKNVHILLPPDCNLTEKATFLHLPLLDSQTQNELFKLSGTHIFGGITVWLFNSISRILDVTLAEILLLLWSNLLLLIVAEMK